LERILSIIGNQQRLRKEKQQHVLILASGEKIRHLTVRPWMVAAGLSLGALITVGYIGSAAYLFFRDDLFTSTLARQARMQDAYEERIAALRVQVDSLTSRQYRDQQLVESSVARILDKQKELTKRGEQIDAVLEKAASTIIEPNQIDPVITHSLMPLKRAGMTAPVDPFESLLTSPSTPLITTDRAKSDKLPGLAEKAEAILDHVDESLKSLELEQKSRIVEIATEANRKSETLNRVLASTGLRQASSDFDSVGGPFSEPLTHDLPFDQHLEHLDQTIEQFNRLRATAEALPFGHPAPNKSISSRFGNRIDPFFGRLALHAGVDFEARTGDDVKSTGAGKVIFAGTSGGYGKMVEIEHNKSFTTRYGHLSKISVSNGDMVTAGDVIGKAGSTGRSTGPHVHYEVRRNNRAIDPMRFITAGKEIEPLFK
jgi:murein DD-endopeptidase MepM/ murein hydrolase activator NlpD